MIWKRKSVTEIVSIVFSKYATMLKWLKCSMLQTKCHFKMKFTNIGCW